MANFGELIAGLKNHKNLARLLDMKDSEDLEELRQIFDGIDEDGNGELDFEEFGLFFASRAWSTSATSPRRAATRRISSSRTPFVGEEAPLHRLHLQGRPERRALPVITPSSRT